MIPIFSVDLAAPSSIPVRMDDIDEKLIKLLCTKIGMLMEDHSAQAVMIGIKAADEQKAAVDELVRASKKIEALVTAAHSIAE